MAKQEITLEQAQEVIKAHNAKVDREEAEEARKLIGRFFKYRNTYGSSHEEWWLYGMPTAVSDAGRVTGLTFQHTSLGIIEVQREDHMATLVGNGWTEIGADEFWKAATSIWAEMDTILRRYPE